MLVAFLSDIHSNLEALEAVTKDIDELKIKKIFCAGDVIGYGPNPNECLEIIKKRKIPCCIGNHESAVITQETYNLNIFATEAIMWTIEHITEENLEFIKNFPEKIEIKLNGIKILMVHGSPFDPVNEYVYPEYPLENIVNEFNYDVIIMAHTHIPFIRKVKNCLVINSGAVGQPRDRSPEACYAVFDTKNKKAKILRIKYDIKTASEKIVRSGLPQFLAQRLFLGV